MFRVLVKRVCVFVRTLDGGQQNLYNFRRKFDLVQIVTISTSYKISMKILKHRKLIERQRRKNCRQLIDRKLVNLTRSLRYVQKKQFSVNLFKIAAKIVESSGRFYSLFLAVKNHITRTETFYRYLCKISLITL